MQQAKLIISLSIITGVCLYLSKFLRSSFADQPQVLFMLGFLPNLGMALLIPFIYISNRLRQKKSIDHFNAVCIFTILLMILNEVRDKWQDGRVFDLLDIYASIAGVCIAYLIFQLTLKKLLKPEPVNQ